MTVTDIVKNKKAEGYAVFADGEFLFSLSDELIIKENIKKGTEITDERAVELKFLSEYFKAKEKAFRMLERREHCRGEIVKKLSEKFPHDVSVKVADDMVRMGLVDDRRFAEMLFRELSSVKKYGIGRIKNEFYRRGIDKTVSEEVLSEYETDEQYLKIVDELRRRSPDLSDEKIRRRYVGKFQRNGYSFGDIKRAFSEYGEELNIEYDG